MAPKKKVSGFIKLQIEAWRQLAGGTDPVSKATPGTIRGDLVLKQWRIVLR